MEYLSSSRPCARRDAGAGHVGRAHTVGEGFARDGRIACHGSSSDDRQPHTIEKIVGNEIAFNIQASFLDALWSFQRVPSCHDVNQKIVRSEVNKQVPPVRCDQLQASYQTG